MASSIRARYYEGERAREARNERRRRLLRGIRRIHCRDQPQTLGAGGLRDVRRRAGLGFRPRRARRRRAPVRRGNSADRDFVVCVFDPARDDLELFWRGPDRKPYNRFSAIAEALKAQKRQLVFAMNGGMFEKNFSPVGLYIEDGKQLQRADTRGGGSNFHLRPQRNLLDRQGRRRRRRDDALSRRPARLALRHAIRAAAGARRPYSSQDPADRNL